VTRAVQRGSASGEWLLREALDRPYVDQGADHAPSLAKISLCGASTSFGVSGPS
jgi:hypothetical protein